MRSTTSRIFTRNSFQINFDTEVLEDAGIKHNDLLHIKYLGGDNLLQGVDGSDVDLFNAQFNIRFTGPTLTGTKGLAAATEDINYLIYKKDLVSGFVDAATNNNSTLNIADASATNGGGLIYYVEDTGITSNQDGSLAELSRAVAAYSLDTTSITKVDSDGTTTSPNSISGFSLTATGALVFNPNNGAFDGLASGETIHISGKYNFINTNSETASNQFIITITSDGNTRTATYLPNQILLILQSAL